jgi:hypothetical protein
MLMLCTHKRKSVLATEMHCSLVLLRTLRTNRPKREFVSRKTSWPKEEKSVLAKISSAGQQSCKDALPKGCLQPKGVLAKLAPAVRTRTQLLPDRIESNLPAPAVQPIGCVASVVHGKRRQQPTGRWRSVMQRRLRGERFWRHGGPRRSHATAGGSSSRLANRNARQQIGSGRAGSCCSHPWLRSQTSTIYGILDRWILGVVTSISLCSSSTAPTLATCLASAAPPRQEPSHALHRYLLYQPNDSAISSKYKPTLPPSPGVADGVPPPPLGLCQPLDGALAAQIAVNRLQSQWLTGSVLVSSVSSSSGRARELGTSTRPDGGSAVQRGCGARDRWRVSAG